MSAEMPAAGDPVNRLLNPDTLAAPAAAYSHGVVTRAGARLVHTSGVVPVLSGGVVPVGLRAQAHTVWTNIAEILAEAGMTVRDIVSVTTYVVVGEDLAVVMTERDEALGGHRPASTLVTVPALARPEWKVEIAVVAAAA